MKVNAELPEKLEKVWFEWLGHMHQLTLHGIDGVGVVANWNQPVWCCGYIAVSGTGAYFSEALLLPIGQLFKIWQCLR